jgi:uncharacterized tellurite resistance protein B-like protein
MKPSSLRAIKNIHFSEVFTDFEKSAVVKVLMMLCTTDTEFHEHEQEFIKELIAIFQINRRQFEYLNKMTDERAYELLSAMHQSKKMMLYQLMKAAVTADGAVHIEERNLFKEICMNAGIVNADA